MKEIKLLDRVQAVLLLHIIFILATIQEYALKIKPAFNNYSHISLKFDINVFEKSVIV